MFNYSQANTHHVSGGESTWRNANTIKIKCPKFNHSPTHFVNWKHPRPIYIHIHLLHKRSVRWLATIRLCFQPLHVPVEFNCHLKVAEYYVTKSGTFVAGDYQGDVASSCKFLHLHPITGKRNIPNSTTLLQVIMTAKLRFEAKQSTLNRIFMSGSVARLTSLVRIMRHDHKYAVI